ncbi:MAG: AsmA-like C-terminal region-containing protein [Rhodomicrobiaceae bacterium]
MRGGRPTPYKRPGVAGSSRALVAVDRRVPVPRPGEVRLKAVRLLGRLCLRTFIVIAVVAAAGFAALQARLSHSPISMSFLVPPIENAVNRNLPDLHFDIGDAVLRRSAGGWGVEFRLANVRLLDGTNSPVVESPFASASVSAQALLSGNFAAGHIDLIGPRLYLHYSDERGLALSFTDPQDSKGDLESGNPASTQSPAVSAGRVQQGAQQADSEEASQGVIREARGRAVSLTKAMSDVFSKIRRGQSAYLTSFGIKDALVYFDQGEQIASWAVPDARIDMRHDGQDSAVEGNVTVQSPNEAFALKFRAQQNRRTGQLDLSLLVDDIIPSAFSGDFPNLRLPSILHMPVSLSAQMTLGGNGDILSANVQAALKKGEFFAPWEKVFPAVIDQGYLEASYSREQGLIQLSEAEIGWGGSRIKLSGLLQRQRETGIWAFLFSTDEIMLGAEQFGLPVIPLDRMEAQGHFDPGRGAVTLDRFFVQAADAHIVLAGSVAQGKKSPAIRLSGQISPMPIAFFKLIWPKFIAHGAWNWIGYRVPSGRITDGTVNIDIPADLLAELPRGANLPSEAVDFRLALEDMTVHYIEGLPPMKIAKAEARVAGQRFFLNAPEAKVTAPSGEIVSFSDGQFIVGDLRPQTPNGEVHFKSDASASAVLSLLNHPNLGYVSALNMPIPEIGGEVESTFSIGMPLVRDLKFAAMKLNGRSQIAGIQATNLPGDVEISGGSVNFNVSEKALEAQGEVRMNGMPVLIGWQRIFDAPSERQPPLRLRTVIDGKIRKQLGLDLDHLIQGAAGAELTVDFGGTPSPKLHFEFNLAETDLIVASLGWRKPPGRRAVLSFDLVPLEGGAMEVQNVNLRGDELNVQGALRINEQKQPVAFDFPVVDLNPETKLQINGQLGAKNIWKVGVKGRSYDGRRFFRSLFSAGQLVENQPNLPEKTPGVDITVDLDTVIGFFDTELKNVNVTAQRRNNELSALELHGLLNGNRPLAARIQSGKGQARQILAEATDAGAAFRLVGFYPSARGGELSLRVDLDGQGSTQKSGLLYVRNFSVANDQVVEEVLSGPGQQARAQARQAQQSDQLRFDRMRVPFSVGQGRFILHDAAINGPVLGATMRGAIDFKQERINVSGTYVPLYGINGALGAFPIIGELLVSRSGEGLFGITFAVKGPTSKPDVLVNPMSMVAPGFLRQLFEFDQNETGAGAPGRPGDGRSSSLPQPPTR